MLHLSCWIDPYGWVLGRGYWLDLSVCQNRQRKRSRMPSWRSCTLRLRWPRSDQDKNIQMKRWQSEVQGGSLFLRWWCKNRFPWCFFYLVSQNVVSHFLALVTYHHRSVYGTSYPRCYYYCTTAHSYLWQLAYPAFFILSSRYEYLCFRRTKRKIQKLHQSYKRMQCILSTNDCRISLSLMRHSWRNRYELEYS